MVATLGQNQQQLLGKQEVIAYIGANAPASGVDPAAMLAIAEQEGLNHGPDSGKGLSWIVPGEGNISFGPPSWFAGTPGNPAAGTAIVQMQGGNAPAWSWTPAGLDYWIQQVAASKGVQGAVGYDAIAAIVNNFERPSTNYNGRNLALEEITTAARNYVSFQQQIAAGTGNTIVSTPTTPGQLVIPPIQIPGQTQPGPFPTPSNPQTKPSTTTTAKFSMHLFDLPTGPVNLTLPWDFSGILLFLAAIFAIIIGAILWKPSREGITTTAQMAAL